MLGVQSSDAAEVGEELAAGDELEHEVEVPRVLAEAFEVDLGISLAIGYNEGVLEVAEDGVFVDDVVDLLEADDFGLFETLEGDIAIGLFVACQFHSPERP